MATSNYTPNLHLSAWEETDRPKRADFVSDNNIIDTQLGGHIGNSNIHMTAAEKAKLSEPYVCAVYAGSGEAERTVSLGFVPKFAIVYKRGAPPATYTNGVMYANSGYAFYGNGSSSGLSISSSGVTVQQSAAASDGVRANLNESGSQYTLVAFK